MVGSGGTARTGELLDRLLRDPAALSRWQAEADRVVAASSAGHLVHEIDLRPGQPGGAGRRPWRIDPIPVLLDGATFDGLGAAVAQRMAAFELILADLYGPRQLVRDGVVPGEALSATPRYRVATVGVPAPPRWLTTYAVDVVALADGSWRVVQDLTDTPTGIGYALIDRAALERVAGEMAAADVASIARFPADLHRALVTTTAAANPRVVLYTGGVDQPGYVEHSWLARLLGFTIVERPDLVVRQGRLWLRTLATGRDGGLAPIDVVYRRVGDDRVDPIELGSSGADGVPGLLAAVAEGGAVLANAHGAGLVEERDLAACWPAAVEALTGRSLELRALAGSAAFATVPILRAGEIAAAPVVVRLHAVAGPDGVIVMPGGNGRVLAPGDDPRTPGARRVKDVWVVGRGASRPLTVAPALPQVDFALSVPTRAADALYGLGRSVERAEAIARTMRVVAGRRRADPGLAVLAGGEWARRVARALRAVRAADRDRSGTAPPASGAIDDELAAATRALGAHLREFVADAATVGEFLASSAVSGLSTVVRVLGEIGDEPASMAAIDDLLAALAEFTGLWAESTVRGPAWRFGDIGRRLERALVVLDLVEACLDPADPDRPGEPAVASSIEVLLAANESLVAYRRQHRSDVELAPTLALLIGDPGNPRAYRSCLDRLAEHVADVGWAEGGRRIAALAAAVPYAVADDWPGAAGVLDRLAGARAGLTELAGALVTTWFATPVKPTLVLSSRRP